MRTERPRKGIPRVPRHRRGAKTEIWQRAGRGYGMLELAHAVIMSQLTNTALQMCMGASARRQFQLMSGA
jgi:hypothetical protein